MIPDCDGRSDGQTESIIANTALCIARAMLTRCKNERRKNSTALATIASTHPHNNVDVHQKIGCRMKTSEKNLECKVFWSTSNNLNCTSMGM